MCAPNQRIVEHSEDVELHRGVLTRIVRLAAFAVSAAIEREHTIARREQIDSAISDPASGVVREAVKEDDRIADADVEVMKTDPVRLEEPRLHPSGCYRSSHRTAHVMSSSGRRTTMPVLTSAARRG